MAVFPRISARRGQTVDLDVTFYHGGAAGEPYAIRRIDIFKTQPISHNLVATIPVLDPADPDYPLPVQPELIGAEPGLCGTEPPAPASSVPGRYHLLYDVPADFYVPDVYFDIWYYYPIDPCYGSDCNLDDPSLSGYLLSSCHRFWVYPDEWFTTDALETVRYGFEPLDQKFHQPEIKPLEVGIMPLPLYDHNHNLSVSILPYLNATITIETGHAEVLKRDEPMSIGLRQGSYRSNPWVFRYLVDTSEFLKGTYKYRITLHLPDGTSRTSKSYILTVN